MYDRFKDVEKIKAEIQSFSEETEEADNILECKRLSYSYDDKMIFNKFDFFVKKHEIVGLYGSNGSGKSTFANILTRSNEGFEGTIKFQGADITRVNRIELRSSILLVSSDDFIFEDSIYNNICLGETIEEDKILDACYKCDIVPSITNDLNDIIMSNGANLSTGQRKRVLMARACVRQPDLLILDEMTSNLDENTSDSMLEMINRMKNKMSIILISHRKEDFKICGRIYNMERSL